uniref:Metalloendopeptidase n=1 Tax=Astyanax mexicanus TaxID=7994 RepID=A0A3B1JIE5_ASTMX
MQYHSVASLKQVTELTVRYSFTHIKERTAEQCGEGVFEESFYEREEVSMKTELKVPLPCGSAGPEYSSISFVYIYIYISFYSFEQMRLKSCIEFVPRTTEEDYVSIESQDGCWSDVGMRGGMQTLSIGDGCAFLSTVEHEFLHCLGFNHEQSRYDRDDYVEIVTENIIAGHPQLHNFDKESMQSSTTQGTPYDYTSVMHYGQDAFTNGNGNTILTQVPRFQNVIGQEYDLSPWDSYELSKLYNCSTYISYYYYFFKYKE